MGESDMIALLRTSRELSNAEKIGNHKSGLDNLKSISWNKPSRKKHIKSGDQYFKINMYKFAMKSFGIIKNWKFDMLLVYLLWVYNIAKSWQHRNSF